MVSFDTQFSFSFITLLLQLLFRLIWGRHLKVGYNKFTRNDIRQSKYHLSVHKVLLFVHYRIYRSSAAENQQVHIPFTKWKRYMYRVCHTRRDFNFVVGKSNTCRASKLIRGTLLGFSSFAGQKKTRGKTRRPLSEENPRGSCISPDGSSCKCLTNTSRRVSLARRLNETSWRTQAKT